MKGPTEKNFEGIYANPRFMHAAGMIVGCIVHVQVKSGSMYEGVLRTFSSKADFVLEMARKVDCKRTANNSAGLSNSLSTITSPEEIIEKIVFKFDDVVTINAPNVDPEFATRESFTDTAISKFNGQVLERELEPWDGGSLSTDGLSEIGGTEEANGWDPNDMFRTNEEKYGVKSSFDSNLPGYTIPLNKQNTEEYKQQEAKATKIAQEIESGFHHKTRAALENGDEEDRFSAVVRPENANNNNFRYVSHRTRKPQNVRNIRSSPAPSHHTNRNSHPHSQVFHRVSSPASAVNNSQGNYKMVSSVSSTTCVTTSSPRPTPTSTPTPRQSVVPPSQMPIQQPSPPAQYQTVPVTSTVLSGNTTVSRATPPATPTVPQGEENHKINGEAEKAELKFAPKPPRSLNIQSVSNKDMRDTASNQQVVNKNVERRKEMEKKTMGQKARDDKTEDLKRFHAKFKLSEDGKDTYDGKDSSPKTESQSNINVGPSLPAKHQNKEKPKEEERKIESIPENRASPDNPKSSTLNPNAKEFVFNPNAKTFTPRGIPMQTVVAPPVQPPPRLHTQSPIMAMHQPHMLPGMAQTVFNMAPHYVVSANPVSVPMAPPFTPAASVTQAPRFRKDQEYGLDMGLNQYEDVIFSAMPMTLQRHDLSQPVHVQAATGQPILAQPTLSAPQFTIQYAPTPGMLHPPGPPQQLAYAQMYSLMPRVLTPQPVGMVPTSAAYGDNPQLPTHVYMPHPGTPSLQHAMASANSGQHSAPSTPQSQTPNLHPAPSPVHQPPPPPPQQNPSGNHGQPPTPTGHPGNAPTPQPVMYATHGHISAQHPLHAANHPSTGQGHPFATAASYAGGPQPIVLLQQQPHAPHPATFASSLQSHPLHGQTPGSHVGTPTHVLPHTQMAMIPTSAAMVHTPTAISTGHYVPHSQGISAGRTSFSISAKPFI
ncbi:ataxin-2-like protein [Uloborus diversus]|uniref:ataxin-2-like protein n=1 Tax=Uloborus diversus TaxID=327109 RepID=UPI00240918C6|nr:ataxin-2-like protein [Uloborus diversus]